MNDAAYFVIVNVMKHISYFISPPQMEQTGHQQYEKKRKKKEKYTSVEACSVPHHPAQRYTYA